MPLQPGSDSATIGSNIHELTENGSKQRSHEQIVAIALHNAHYHEKHSPDDEGHVGAHQNDTVMLHNSHPHQQHSVGYHIESPRHTKTMNHEFEGVHITHHARDKAGEHHPPKGLMEHGATPHGVDTEEAY